MAPETFSDLTVILEFFLLGSNTFHGTWSTRDTKTPRTLVSCWNKQKKGGIDVDTIITSWLLISRKNTSMFF
jgi:muramoyltetrapeptide carboxypeptidase LdcA involved in peptidoglycan recycling